MKITLFTSDKKRHNYLIYLLSNISKELFVIQEYTTSASTSNLSTKDLKKSIILKKYFKYVNNAETKLFGNSFKKKSNENIKVLSIISGSLNEYSISSLSDFLKSDIYIIFGSSYIKGQLFNFLVKQKAINIHAGVSPYYRGSDCNFWALYDDNPHLVGSTIHLLSKGLDDGPILYHAMSNIKTNPFEYTMSTTKSAFHSLIEKIKNKSIFKIKATNQKKNKELRFSKNKEFNEEVVKKYFKKKINLDSCKFKNSLLKEPFFLNK